MLHIGNIHIDNPLMLAPIAGFTDSPFRKIARKLGAGLVVTELISCEGIIRHQKKTMELLQFDEAERPLAIQLFGKIPESMAEAAAIVEELKPDIIDINFGCPAPKVCKGGEGSGSALMLEPQKVEAIASSIVKKVSLPVTAKIRLGWDNEHMTYPEVVKALEASGVACIFVHGRTRAQKYSGHADWDAIKAIRKMSSLPVIGNGDIVSHKQAYERMNESGCPGVLIGRGAIGNPWIFSGKVPTRDEKVALIIEHFNAMLEFYGDKGIVLMRKHLAKYIHGFRNASKTRHRLVTSTDADEIIEIVRELEF